MSSMGFMHAREREEANDQPESGHRHCGIIEGIHNRPDLGCGTRRLIFWRVINTQEGFTDFVMRGSEYTSG
jgi:hypothetical protein